MQTRHGRGMASDPFSPRMRDFWFYSWFGLVWFYFILVGFWFILLMLSWFGARVPSHYLLQLFITCCLSSSAFFSEGSRC